MKRIIAGVSIMLGGLVFLATFTHAVLYSTADTAPVNGIVSQTWAADAGAAAAGVSRSAPSSYPSRLVIPSIGIDANVQETTLNYRGAMGVPTNFTDVAWYASGPMPGQLGTAVIDGHYDNGLGLDGVFKRLGGLKVGDDIYVRTKAGTALHFKVASVDQIPYDDPDTSGIFDQQTGRAELKLVTCSGTWVPAHDTYDKRVVITAELVTD